MEATRKFQCTYGTFWAMRLYADYQVRRGNEAFLYFFAQNPPAPAGQPPFPAAHAAEVPYVFNNVGELPLFPDRSDPKLAGASASDLKVADQMSSYWANFARSGDPNHAGLPKWPKFDAKSRGYIEFATSGATAKQALRRPQCDVFIENIQRVSIR